MIDIVAGGYVRRTASVFDYNGDYTLMFAWAYLTSASGGRGVVLVGQDDLSDYDILEADTALKLWVLASAAGGAQQQTSLTGVIATDDTIYYTAIRRTGTTVDLLMGTSPGSMTVVATGTLSDAGRAAADSILFNGYNVGSPHSAVGFLGRVRAFTEARSDASIRAEMKKNQPVDTTALWGNWPMPDNTNLNDDSGNARHFTGSGTINNGPSLPDEFDLSLPLIGPTVTVAGPSSVSAAAALMLPDSTIAAGGWQDQAAGTSDLHSPLADASDATYIKATTQNTIAKIGLLDMLPDSSPASFTIRVRRDA